MPANWLLRKGVETDGVKLLRFVGNLEDGDDVDVDGAEHVEQIDNPEPHRLLKRRDVDELEGARLLRHWIGPAKCLDHLSGFRNIPFGGYEANLQGLAAVPRMRAQQR